jgi:hypothetical protein
MLVINIAPDFIRIPILAAFEREGIEYEFVDTAHIMVDGEDELMFKMKFDKSSIFYAAIVPRTNTKYYEI